MSNAVNEFSRFAHQYEQHNMIQTEVAHRLVSRLTKHKYKTIVDLGCGSGVVYQNMEQQKITYDRFIALDSAKEMLSIHPNDTKIQKLHADFNREDTYQKLNFKKDEVTLFSASALQWSKDLDFVFFHLASLAKEAYFAIFTSGTFETLHNTAGIDSPIYTKEELKEVIERYYNVSFTLQSYRLEFKTVRDMFQYIKKSGVSGGKKQLSYQQVKSLMENYPLNYLEFEVLFVEATSLTL